MILEWRQLVVLCLIFLLPALLAALALLIIKRPMNWLLERLLDLLFPNMPRPWQIAKSFRIGVGPPQIGLTAAPQAVPASGAVQALQPLDAARRAGYAELWRELQARFEGSPADTVRDAERLLTGLMQERGCASLTQPQLVWQANLGTALPSIAAVYRQLQHSQAAARGIAAAKEQRAASIEEFRAALDQYGLSLTQLLNDAADPQSTAPR